MTTLREAADHWREWFDRGELDEGAARIQEALNAPEADPASIDRVRVLYGAHLFASGGGSRLGGMRRRLSISRVSWAMFAARAMA